MPFKNNSQNPVSVPHMPMGMGSPTGGMVNLPGPPHQRKITLPLRASINYQYLQTLPMSILKILTRCSCAGNPHLCEFIYATVMPCPKANIVQHLSPASSSYTPCSPFSVMYLTFPQMGKRDEISTADYSRSLILSTLNSLESLH